jgi:hypothetical protein
MKDNVLDSICIFDAVEFGSQGRAIKRNERPEEYLGTPFSMSSLYHI